jgi:hypothetical protein
MNDFGDVAFVWCGNSWKDLRDKPVGRPVCSVGAWPMVLGCRILGWDGEKPETIPAAALRRYRVLLVNLFSDSRHISQIRAVHAKAFVLAMPDPYLELVIYDDSSLIYEQMAAADAIGGRTEADVQLYGALLGKPAVWMPSPIGPCDVFRRYWSLPKDNIIIATEHNGGLSTSAATVAALAAVKRQRPEAEVHFYKASDRTRRLAALADLRAEWRAGVPYAEMVERTARARWGIDLYAGHSQGRNLMTHAMAGTPVVGSATNNPAGAMQVGPFEPAMAAGHVLANWQGPRYEARRNEAFETVEALYGFDASRRRMAATLGALL